MPQKTHHSLFLAGKYGKRAKHSTQQCLYANEVKGGLQADRVQPQRALYSLRSKYTLPPEKTPKTQILSNEDNAKCIEH
jgi:hypothetical protein